MILHDIETTPHRFFSHLRIKRTSQCSYTNASEPAVKSVRTSIVRTITIVILAVTRTATYWLQENRSELPMVLDSGMLATSMKEPFRQAFLLADSSARYLVSLVICSAGSTVFSSSFAGGRTVLDSSGLR